jgi:hypothetical protein
MSAPTAVERAAANAIYDVLVELAGAADNDSMRDQFAYFYPKCASLAEFRFMGLLGFSGKIWWTNYQGWYVSGNRSDAEAVAITERTNAALERFNTDRQQSHKR